MNVIALDKIFGFYFAMISVEVIKNLLDPIYFRGFCTCVLYSRPKTPLLSGHPYLPVDFFTA